MQTLWSFQETREQLERKLDMRRKQFHVLVASIHQLQAMLDDSETEEIMDVSLEAFEGDASDLQKTASSQPEAMVE
jgi:THO complex subunit 7